MTSSCALDCFSVFSIHQFWLILKTYFHSWNASVKTPFQESTLVYWANCDRRKPQWQSNDLLRMFELIVVWKVDGHNGLLAIFWLFAIYLPTGFSDVLGICSDLFRWSAMICRYPEYQPNLEHFMEVLEPFFGMTVEEERSQKGCGSPCEVREGQKKMTKSDLKKCWNAEKDIKSIGLLWFIWRP